MEMGRHVNTGQAHAKLGRGHRHQGTHATFAAHMSCSTCNAMCWRASRTTDHTQCRHACSLEGDEDAGLLDDCRGIRNICNAIIDDVSQLEGDEQLALAGWVWQSFRPGQTITDQQRRDEAAKMLRRCDKDGDGCIDEDEFLAYFEQTSAAIEKFQSRPERSPRVPRVANLADTRSSGPHSPAARRSHCAAQLAV